MLRLLMMQCAPCVRTFMRPAPSTAPMRTSGIARRGMAGMASTVGEQFTEAASQVAQKAQAAARTARAHGMRKALAEFRQRLPPDAYVLAVPVTIAVSLLVTMIAHVLLHDPDQSKFSFYTLDPDDEAFDGGGENAYDPTKGPPGRKDKADLSALERAVEAYSHNPVHRFFEKHRMRSRHPYSVFDNDFSGAV